MNKTYTITLSPENTRSNSDLNTLKTHVRNTLNKEINNIIIDTTHIKDLNIDFIKLLIYINVKLTTIQGKLVIISNKNYTKWLKPFNIECTNTTKKAKNILSEIMIKTTNQ